MEIVVHTLVEDVVDVLVVEERVLAAFVLVIARIAQLAVKRLLVLVVPVAVVIVVLAVPSFGVIVAVNAIIAVMVVKGPVSLDAALAIIRVMAIAMVHVDPVARLLVEIVLDRVLTVVLVPPIQERTL